MKYIKLFESYNPKPKKKKSRGETVVPKKVKAYHTSNSANIKQFSTTHDSGLNLFGNALYFSSTYNNITKFGNKLYEVELTLINPLHLNKEMSLSGANALLKKLEQFTGESYDYTFTEEDYDGVQYGEFFMELGNHGDIYNSIGGFIRSLGYDSFIHYADGETNYRENKPTGKYDEVFLTYGVYSDNQIEITQRHFRQEDSYDYDDFEDE